MDSVALAADLQLIECIAFVGGLFIIFCSLWIEVSRAITSGRASRAQAIAELERIVAEVQPSKTSATQMTDHLEDHNLPHAATQLVLQIRRSLALFDENQGQSRVLTEARFTANEMRERYLPETLEAFLSIPESRRAKYEPTLLRQLRVLEQEARSLAELAADETSTALAVNERFLQTRFRSNPLIISNHVHDVNAQ